MALRLVLAPGEGYEGLGRALGIGVGAAHRSVRRLEKAQLVVRERREVLKSHLEEFVIHGLRYAFYVELGPETLGIATAHVSGLLDGGRTFVWPSAHGTHRGESVTPLLPQALDMPQREPDLYRGLAAIDSIRLGGQRERAAAGEWFRAWLSTPSPQR
ncbi:MAG: hypothetical protein ACI9OJ_004050 [Myxococcota bacterium]|jgi:hypothetical protein